MIPLVLQRKDRNYRIPDSICKKCDSQMIKAIDDNGQDIWYCHLCGAEYPRGIRNETKNIKPDSNG